MTASVQGGTAYGGLQQLPPELVIAASIPYHEKYKLHSR